MADQDPTNPPWLHLLSAFLSMEPTHSLLELARVCGEGSVTEEVQRFIWNHCINEANGKFHKPYVKNFIKKLIGEAELSSCSVLDEIYELYAHYMTSLKDDFGGKESMRVCKSISFLFTDESFELSSCPKSRKLVVKLQCSLNMLEGDTGCSVWPSSLYLSEFILSYPDLFANKSCFEVGSGVGLVGVCLYHVKASEVILTDGDMSALENMRLNLELNELNNEDDKVKCVHLAWEFSSEEQLQSFKADIILGADVIYDPLCLPSLVRVLKTLLKQNEFVDNDNGDGFEFNDLVSETKADVVRRLGSSKNPWALIASVIRNVDTFNTFLGLIEEADLNITDLTETLKPINLLPYMNSYNRPNVRLFVVTLK